MTKNYSNSQTSYQEALRLIPGGVNSPVRAFKAVGEHPLFIQEGQGARITDIDGNRFLDYMCSWGPLILGHRHPLVMQALRKCVDNVGTSFGAPTRLETELAEVICQAMPAVEMVRMVNSGTEATMSALRLARAYTGRDKILKFEGCYHGHADALLIKAGSGALTLGVPSSPGVPRELAGGTLTASYNDLDSVRQVFKTMGKEIAAVILEPVAGNMGVVPPRPGFLEGVREITRENGSLLIFDEVITGFRVAWGGAQAYYGIDPDLTCMGKIIGGGLPVGAYGGKKQIMEMVAPAGAVYQAGTLSGNPLAMSAGLATLRVLKEQDVYTELEKTASRLAEGLQEAARLAGVPVAVNRVGSLLTCFFTTGPVMDYQAATSSDTVKFGRFFRAMLEEGIYLPPAQFEAWFISAAHTDEDIEVTIEAAARAFTRI